MALVSPCANVGPWAISVASAIASSSTVSGVQMRFRKPHCIASSPGMARPVYSSSLARPCPMIRGSIAQAPMSQPASPTRLNRNAVLLRDVPNRMSDAMARIAPAPAHTPSMLATIGCGQWRMAFTSAPVMRVKRSSSGAGSPISGAMISRTSPPELKLPPAPCSTIAFTSSAWRSCSNRSRNSAYEAKVSGFFRSGRCSVMTPTRPRSSH